MDSVKIVDCQNAIIKIQSDVIDELFALLTQHITVEEMDRLPALAKIRDVVVLKSQV